MLASMSVERRPGTYAVIALDGPPPGDLQMEAAVLEDEGWTVVVADTVADARGWTGERGWAWLTLGVHSALDAVGLTAAVSAALADEGLPCNVLAAAHHDHLLVPGAHAERAIDAILALRRS
jgi:hypothetical protein